MSKRMALRTMLLTMAVLGGACSSRATNVSGDQGPAGDGGGPRADLGPSSDTTPLKPPSGWRFTSGDDGSALAAVSLRQADDGAPVGDTVTLEVLVRGVSQLQGVAFRLLFDPERVEVVSSEASELWTTPFVAKFAPRAEGQLWAGIGNVGRRGRPASEPTVVARVTLRVKGAAAVALPLALPAHRGQVVDAMGSAVDVTWIGGQLVPVE